jgi:hypothetical protein
MKTTWLIGILLVAAAAIGFVYLPQNKPLTGGVACTMEVKLCPDGSAVGRVGPKCEFAPCPTPSPSATTQAGTAVIKGKVTVGPICPVEQLNSPCPVPPTAYTSRQIILYSADGTTEIKRMNFTPDGTYQFEVPPGTYVLNTPKQGIGGAKGLPKTITVISGETSEYDFPIDTGIR